MDERHVDLTDHVSGGSQGGEHTAQDDGAEGTGNGDDRTGAGSATVGEGAQADTDHDDEGDEQEGATDPDHGSERATCLAHRKCCKRNATEGHTPAHELSQGDGAHQPDPSTATCGDDHGRQTEEGTVEEQDDRPAGWGEVPHPEGAGGQPHGGDEHRPGEAASALLFGEQPIEEGDPGEGRRPPTPRRDRCGQQQTGRHCQGDGAPWGGHGAQPIRGPGCRFPLVGQAPRTSTPDSPEGEITWSTHLQAGVVSGATPTIEPRCRPVSCVASVGPGRNLHEIPTGTRSGRVNHRRSGLGA